MKTNIICWAVFVVAQLWLAAGCASVHRVQNLESQITESKGRAGLSTVGLNNEKEVVVQEETDAATELSVAENVSLHFRTELNHEAFMLNKCRQEQALESGIMPEDAITDIQNGEEIREEMGLDNQGSLKIVKTSYFKDRLKAERGYRVAAERMLKVVKRQRSECEFKQKSQRTQVQQQSVRQAVQPVEVQQPELYDERG